MAGAIGRTKTGREAGDAALDFEAALFQELGHELRSFELLHAELGEVKDAVIERGNRLGVAIEILVTEHLLACDVVDLFGHRSCLRMRVLKHSSAIDSLIPAQAGTSTVLASVTGSPLSRGTSGT